MGSRKSGASPDPAPCLKFLQRVMEGWSVLVRLLIQVSYDRHAVYMIVGEFEAVRCVTRTVVDERPSMGAPDGMSHVDVDDWAVVTADLVNGSTGTIEVSRVHAGLFRYDA